MDVARATNALMWIALPFVILGLLLASLSSAGYLDRARPWMRNLHFLFGLVGVVIVMAAVMNFGFQFPDAFASEGWFDSEDYDTEGLGWGMYLGLVAGIVLLFGTALAVRLPQERSAARAA